MKRISFYRVILVLCIINFILKLPFVKIPAIQDEVSYFWGVNAVAQNNLNPFVYFWGYKPPVMFEIPAAATKLFGESIIWGRLYVYLLSSLSIWFLYLLGRRMFNEKVGFGAAVMLFCFPLFQIESLQFLDAEPLVFFLLLYLYFYSGKSYKRILMAGIMLVLTKEVAIFVPIFLIIKEIDDGIKNTKIDKTMLLVLILPIIVFGLWMVVNKVTFGWYLFPYNTGLISWKNISLTDFFWFSGKDLFPLIVFTTGSVVFLWWKKLYSAKSQMWVNILVVFFLFYIVLFTLMVHAIRYILFVYPLLFLVFLFNSVLVFNIRWKYLAAASCLLFWVVCIWNQNYGEYSNEPYDFKVLVSSILFRQITSYVDSNTNNPIIVTSSHGLEYFEDPLFGYVKRKYETRQIGCDTCKLLKYKLNSIGDERDIVFIDSNINCCHLSKGLFSDKLINSFIQYSESGKILFTGNIFKVSKSDLRELER